MTFHLSILGMDRKPKYFLKSHETTMYARFFTQRRLLNKDLSYEPHFAIAVWVENQTII